MTRRRWIADEYDQRRSRAALLGANAAHLARVLRAEVGQEFDIVLEDSAVRSGRIVSVSSERVEFALGEGLQAATAAVEVTLLLASFKFDRMEWAIEKATELGVAAIVPVIAERSGVHLARAAVKRAERWRRIAHEAAQQARRGSVPGVQSPAKLKDAVAGFQQARFVLDEGPGAAFLGLLLASHPPRVALAVGPEGGWTPKERKLFLDSGWQPASLGGNILRAETAAIAALAVTLAPRS